MSNTNNTERLMIARLTISRWSPRKFDRAATEELARLHNADPDEIGRFNKLLIEAASIKPIEKAQGELRREHHRLTSPWDDDGARVLPTELYFEYTGIVNKARAQIERLVGKFVAEDYAEQLAKAQTRLNGLFSPTDYPPANELAHRFSARVRFEPLPNPDDARVWGIGAKAAEAIRADLEESISERLQVAQNDVIQRVHDRAREFVDKCRAFDKGDTKSIWTTAVTNLRDVTETVLKGLNVTGDPQLTKLTQELADAIDGLNVEQLRHGKSLRRGKIDEVNDVVKKLAGAFPAAVRTA